MKLELSIADDRELRAFIKDSIKGEVRSIARGEIKSILAAVTEEKIIPRTPDELNRIVRDIIKEEVRRQLRDRSSGYNSPTILVDVTREVVREILEEMWKNRGPAKSI